MKIALIGFGVVGQGLAQILLDKGTDLAARYGFEAQIAAVVTRTRGSLMHPGGLDLAALLAAAQSGSLANYPDQPGLARGASAVTIASESFADVLVEVSPSNLTDGQPAIDICEAAFASGKHVVLANKGALLHGYTRLNKAAQAARRRLLFEASVMAGTPSLRLGMQALAGCTITRARGIVNGTTNYILTQMEGGLSYADALAEAQRLGYAETDPTADVEGWDAAAKAVILGAALFGRQFRFAEMTVKGISQLAPDDVAAAASAGERWKLIAEVTPDGASVTPMRLPVAHPLASVAGATNALTITTDLLGDVTLIGKGAGGIQTGFGLLSDLLEIHRSPAG
jgi:homoserine dehydrogenase